MFDKMPDEQTFYTTAGSFTVSWSAKGVGFGQFVFFRTPGEKVKIDNETMSKGYIKETLCRMIDGAELVDAVSPEQAARGETKFKEFVNGGKLCPVPN